MNEMIVNCGGKVVLRKPVVDVKVQSKWTGDLEESRKSLIEKVVSCIFPTVVMTKLTMATASTTFAATTSAEQIRSGFHEILDVFTAIAEPILWFYALTACIMMATKNKQAGLDRLKQVGYAYAGIALLPTFFAFLRWIAELIKGSISF